MKKYIWNSVINVVLIIIAIVVMIQVGFRVTFGFIDEGDHTISVYSEENVSIDSIAFFKISGAPIQVQSGTPYSGIVVVYDGESIPLDEYFKFNNSGHKKQSLDFWYSVEDDALYLDRTVKYLNGFKTWSLVMACVFIINLKQLILNIGLMVEERKELGDVYQVSNTRHFKNSLDRFTLITLAMIGLYLFASYFIVDLQFIAYQLSDNMILYGSMGILLVNLFGSVIYEFATNNTHIEFDGGMTRVRKGENILFEERTDNILYQETMIRNANTFMNKEYSALKLQLKSKDTGVIGIDLDMMPFGERMFKSIRSRFSNANDAILHHASRDPEGSDNGRYTLKARSFKALRLYSLIFVIAMVVVYPAVIVGAFVSNITDIIAIMIVVTVPLIMIGIYVFLVSKTMKPVTFVLTQNTIQVDDDIIERDMIKTIRVSYPAEFSGTARMLDIRLNRGRKQWQFPAKRMNDKSVKNEVEFTRLYHGLNRYYKDLIKEI